MSPVVCPMEQASTRYQPIQYSMAVCVPQQPGTCVSLAFLKL